MAFPIIPKRRSGASGNPSSLQLGELAVNTLNGELYLGADGGVTLLNGPVSAGTTVTEHTGDGTTTAFTFAGFNGTADGGYIVSVGGIDQPPSKYTITNTAGGTITFVEAPVVGELISIRAIVAGEGGGGGITELTGDVTASGTGSVVAMLASVTTAQSNAGSATVIPVLSIDEKGRVTSLSTTEFAALTTNQIAGLSTSEPAALATAPVVGLSTFAARADHQHELPTAAQVGALDATAAAGGDLTGNYPNPTLAAVTTAQSNVGSSSVVPVLSIDAKGRVTALSTAALSAPAGFTVAALQTQSLTIDATFAQKIIPFQVDTGAIVTLPSDANASITPGVEIKATTNGTGEVTFQAGSGATLLAPGNLTAIGTQYTAATVTKLFPNTWFLSGSNLTQSSYVDPYFSSVSLLLHMNGANNGTSFPDNSANNYTVTPNGGAITSTAVFKFGTASYLGGSGRYLTVSTDNTPFAFGTGDFTIEFWIRPTAFSTQQNLIVFSNLTNSAIIVATNGVCSYQLSNVNRLSTTALSANSWFHVAISRVAGTSRMFLNGALQGSYTDATNYLSTGTLWQIGGAGSPLIGNLDDLRVTKGVGRYTVTFSVPIAEFPNS